MNNIPDKVNEILKQYFNLLESKLPGFIEGYYLYGSVSLGAYRDGFSDIDFAAVTSRKATEADIDILKEIHSTMQKRNPKLVMDGMYLSMKDMESINKCESACLRFNDGKFIGFKKFDRNSIDAYQLKKYGITIKGQDIKSYNYEVNWDILIGNMRDNLNTYWFDWMNGCKKFPSVKYLGLFISLGMIEWGVLGVSRLYYTFREGDMTSKVGAGEYALRTVPQKWHRIINESMRLKKGNDRSSYKSIIKRRNDALNYMEFIIQESNNLFKEKK